MTPQDIKEKTFEKALVGGYDMGSVDDFLEKVAADLTASQKEISVLKAKMKVLVDKIEEYRANEDALNRALLSAQKLSVQIEAEARHKADVAVAEANTQVQSIVGGIAAKREAEESLLNDAKQSTAAYIASAKKMLQDQLKHLDVLSDELTDGTVPEYIPASTIPSAPVIPEFEPEEEVEPYTDSKDIDDAVKSIEDSVARIQSEPATSIDFAGIEEENEEANEEEAAAPHSEVSDDTQLFTFDDQG